MNPLGFSIAGVGAWGLTFRDWAGLQASLLGEPPEDDGAKGPKPEVIPANERRRAPLPVRLAVETSWQATQESGFQADELGSVFVSGLGDTQLTDYMCKALARENKALSPTKFHNSVHNAAAGYWTISTGCMQAANSIAAFQESASLTLLEALIQAETEKRPLLLTFYDAPVAPILQGMLENESAFSFSFVLIPKSTLDTPAYNARVVQEAVGWPQITGSPELQSCYASNPAAKILALAELMQSQSGAVLRLPLSVATSLEITKS